MGIKQDMRRLYKCPICGVEEWHDGSTQCDKCGKFMKKINYRPPDKEMKWN